MNVYIANIRVYGKVQGVMYRDYIKRYARRVGILGYVKNLRDGTVFIYACSNKKIYLLKLINRAKRGSIFSKVSRVEVKIRKFKDVSCVYVFNKFIIKY